MKVKPGWAFHCHHDRLVEFVTDYQERVDYISYWDELHLVFSGIMRIGHWQF